MLLCLLMWALAADAPPPPGVAFHDALGAAKDAVYEGAYERALATLEALEDRLRAGEEPGRILATEAMLYLGDVRFVLDDPASAREAFTWILERHPDTTMSPYDHGEDVRSLFALVREEVERTRPLPPPDPDPVDPPEPPVLRPLPARYYLPFGVARWSDRGAGPRWNSALQLTLAAGSIGSFVLLDRVNRESTEERTGWTEEQVRVGRYGVQWPLTVGFYAAWGYSVYRAAHSWRQRPVGVAFDGRGIQIHGSLPSRRDPASAGPPRVR
jgi:hypothetical protein